MGAALTQKEVQFTHRDLLRAAALGVVSLPVGALVSGCKKRTEFVEPARVPYAGSDDALLEEIERTAFEFFWNEAGAATGQVKDRALLNGNDSHFISSIAATGFGLTGLCIGEARGYRKNEEILERN